MITRRENLKLLCSLPLINLNLDIPQEYKKAQINFRSSNTNEWEKRFSEALWKEAEKIGGKLIEPTHIDDAVITTLKNNYWKDLL